LPTGAVLIDTAAYCASSIPDEELGRGSINKACYSATYKDD
jgi:hypothetical protein